MINKFFSCKGTGELKCGKIPKRNEKELRR